MIPAQVNKLAKKIKMAMVRKLSQHKIISEGKAIANKGKVLVAN